MASKSGRKGERGLDNFEEHLKSECLQKATLKWKMFPESSQRKKMEICKNILLRSIYSISLARYAVCSISQPPNSLSSPLRQPQRSIFNLNWSFSHIFANLAVIVHYGDVFFLCICGVLNKIIPKTNTICEEPESLRTLNKIGLETNTICDFFLHSSLKNQEPMKFRAFIVICAKPWCMLPVEGSGSSEWRNFFLGQL